MTASRGCTACVVKAAVHDFFRDYQGSQKAPSAGHSTGRRPAEPLASFALGSFLEFSLFQRVEPKSREWHHRSFLMTCSMTSRHQASVVFGVKIWRPRYMPVL